MIRPLIFMAALLLIMGRKPISEKYPDLWSKIECLYYILLTVLTLVVFVICAQGVYMLILGDSRLVEKVASCIFAVSVVLFLGAVNIDVWRKYKSSRKSR